jgi:hypothetical protein
VIEHPLHDVQRHLVVDHPGADGVPELMRGDLHRLARGVADIAVGEPPLKAPVQGRP